MIGGVDDSRGMRPCSVLPALGLVSRSIFVFDEFICYETWDQDEALAWVEAVAKNGWVVEPLALSVATKQAVFRVIDVPHENFPTVRCEDPGSSTTGDWAFGLLK